MLSMCGAADGRVRERRNDEASPGCSDEDALRGTCVAAPVRAGIVVHTDLPTVLLTSIEHFAGPLQSLLAPILGDVMGTW